MSNTHTYFGKVMDVADEKFIFRVRVAIPGFTDQLAVEDLAWYFPYYGVNFLPQIDDVVPVVIFDDDFRSGMYGRKVDNLKRELEDADYENYLEIFQRAVDDKNVQLTYIPSLGIQFINDTGNVHVETEKVSMYITDPATMSVVLTKDLVTIGKPDDAQKTLLGEDTIKYLKEQQLEFSKAIAKELGDLVKDLMSAAGGNPYTANLVSPLTKHMASSMQVQQHKATQFDHNSLLSETVKNS